MNLIQFCSDNTLGRDTRYYVAKFSIRKQWALMVDHGTHSDVAAYFRTEPDARRFADTFSLTIHANPDEAPTDD